MAKSGAEDHHKPDKTLSSPHKKPPHEQPKHNTGNLGKPHKPLPGKRPTHLDGDGGLATGWIVLIVIIVLLIAAFIGFTLWRRRKAARQGLPPPSINPFKRPGSPTAANFAAAPAAGGVGAWVSKKFSALQGYNANRQRGRYETGAGYEGSRGVDADEAWDTRMGAEETGYYGANTRKPGGGYQAPGGEFEDHEMDVRGASYEDLHGGSYGRGRHRDSTDSETEHDNPFGGSAERSDWRGVSPRPIDTDAASTRTKDTTRSSPTERRSMFRENV